MDDLAEVSQIGHGVGIVSKLTWFIEHCDEVLEEEQYSALNNYIKLFVHLPISDHVTLLSPVVELLTWRPSGEAMEMQCKICDMLCRLINGEEPGIRERFGKWKEIIANEVMSDSINIFQAVETLMLMPPADLCIGNKRLAACINLITTVLNCNTYVKKSFDELLGVKKLKADLMLYSSMDVEVGDALLELLTVLNNKVIVVTERVITITSLVPVIVQLIPLFDDAAQRKISESIRIMCASILQNRLTCCHIGLISDILKLLGIHGKDLSNGIKDCLISTMEILGCLSITSAEIKLLIGLFHQTAGSQFTHADRLVQSLERMASQNVQYHTQYQPQCFINFYNVYSPTSVRCPSVHHWNGKGVTVHTWICMDFTLANTLEYGRSKVRHVLYCFLNARGEGFEAFFTEEGFLVLAVHTKKEYLTTTVASSPFNDQEWHGVTIVHTKKLLGRATVAVYVDGQEIHNAQLQYPIFKEISHSYIGQGIKSDSNFHYQIHPPVSLTKASDETPHPEVIAAGSQNQVWGIPSTLKGQMSSFVLFNESLTADKIRELSLPGPNYKHLFTPKHVLSEAHLCETADLLDGIVFYFDAKASCGDEMIDVHPAFRDKTIERQNLKGRIHHVWSIQESIQALGGLAVLFPLLEQACFHKNNFNLEEWSEFLSHGIPLIEENVADECDAEVNAVCSKIKDDKNGINHNNNVEDIMCKNELDTCKRSDGVSLLTVVDTPNDVSHNSIDTCSTSPSIESTGSTSPSTESTKTKNSLDKNMNGNEGVIVDGEFNSEVMHNDCIQKNSSTSIDSSCHVAPEKGTIPIPQTFNVLNNINNNDTNDNDDGVCKSDPSIIDSIKLETKTLTKKLSLPNLRVLTSNSDDKTIEQSSTNSSSKNTYKCSESRKSTDLGTGLKVSLRKSFENITGSSPTYERESPPDFLKMKKTSACSHEWTLLDASSPVTRSDTFKSWAKQDTHQLNGVTHFISLIRYMIGSYKHGKDMFVDLQGIKVIGLLLQSCNPNLINIGFLHSVAQLVESIIGQKEDLLKAVFKYIVFEFKIWHKADISVQIAHTQLLHTYIKDEPELFNSLFGVSFFFRIIELYYCKVNNDSKDKTVLSESEARDLRKALLGLIFYMIKLSSQKDSLNFVISYMSNLSQHKHLDEVLDMLHSIVKIGDTTLNSYITDVGTYIMYRWMVHEIPNESRLKTLVILINLLQHGKLSESMKQKLLLKPNIFPAVGELLCKQEVTRDVVIHLSKLAISLERSMEQEIDIYSDFNVILTVVRVAQCLPRPIKLEVAIKIRSSLKLSSMSAERCASEPGWYDPLWRLILTENNSPCDMDVMEAELVQVVIEIIHIVMWSGIVGSDLPAWTRRCEPLSCLHDLSSRTTNSANPTFLLPVLAIERQLFESCLESAANALKNCEKVFAVDTQNAVQILRLVEDYIFSSEIEFAGQEHCKWSEKLITKLFELLDSMNAWVDSTEDGSEWLEVLQIVERILYKCCMQDNALLLATGSKHLTLLLNRHPVKSKDEACYQLFHLNDVLRSLIQHGVDCEGIMTSMYPRYEMCCITSDAEYESAVQLPHIKLSSFKKEYPTYMESDQEFLKYIKNTVEPICQSYGKGISNSSIDVGRMWMDSLNLMAKSLQQRQMDLESSLQSFSKEIYQCFDEKRSEERGSLEEYKKSCRQKNGISKRFWEYQKRFLTSERGAWKLIRNSQRHFKLSNTENRYRMRLKLTENLKFNPHTDAARQRDLSSSTGVTVEKSPVTIQLSATIDDITVSDHEDKLLSPTGDDDEESAETTNVAESSHLYDLQSFDKITGSCIHFSECRLVTLMDVVAGRIELTATHVCYYDDKENCLDSSNDFKFALDELREIYSRRYNLRKTAMEFFLLDRSSYFVNFPTTKDKEVFYRKLIQQKPKHLYYSGIQTPSKLLRVSRLTSKWVEREISNFEYLMQLNTISGRTYNDLAQYPVFPWILTDYTSETLDLQDESIYRDLSKPVGILNPKKEDEILARYESFVDMSGMTQKSHYFTHYSNPGGVLHYLVRVEPFTSLHIHLQSGRFDCADRLFYALSTSWESVMTGSDVMELIPEFYFFPEFLMNLNGFSLGRLQNSGDDISNVKLPPWAKSPYDFISIHRQALESEYVSANLHSWIDLIFGYKQRGKEAEKAMNVFSHYSYEEAVDLDMIDDPILREATEGMINNFGQTPTQLLKRPHPKRKTLKEIEAGRPIVINQLESSTFSLIEILHMVNPLIFISTCKPRPKSILYQAVPDSLITVHVNGLFGTHAWYTDPKTNSFSFTMDVLLASASSHNQRLLPGTISPSVQYSSRLFAFTTDGHLLISCGYWDSSIRLVNIDRGKDRLKSCVNHHNDIVTCISLDADGSHLISGSADLTCAVWEIEQVNGFSASLSPKPIQILYGHDSCITAVGMHGDLDLAVSGAKDGTCLVHTIRKGVFVHTLKPVSEDDPDAQSTVIQLKISDQGRIVILSNLVGYDMPRHFVSMYSINGAPLGNVVLNQVVRDICIINDYLIIGSMNGTLQIRHTNDLCVAVLSKNVKAPIYTVAATHNGSHIFIGRGDGNILVMCPSKI